MAGIADGKSAGPRVILHLDLDAFYASVEQREDPELDAKPVVVCMYSARGGDSGAVAAASYEARALGVRSGMSIKQAKKLSPEGVFLQARRGFYSEVSENVMDILKSRADSFEQVSIDEAFMDITKTTGGDFKMGANVANEVKLEVKNKEGLSCSVGVGPNKLISKMASSMDKPSGLTVVLPLETDEFLEPLEVSSIWGVGGKTSMALEAIDIHTIGELKTVELPRLILLFGKSRGRWLYDASRGIDDSPVVEKGEREQIGRITTLEEDTMEPEVIEKVVSRLSGEVYDKFKGRGKRFRTVTFYVGTVDMKAHTKSHTLPLSSDELAVIEKTALMLANNFLSCHGVLIRRVGVKISNFGSGKGQKTLLNF